ncbi:DUF134 domain-containing protein [bacterium]|nr:DUF134 domain-containing protein [bacterium]
MPRPPKCRRVNYEAKYLSFKPIGVPIAELEVVTLTIDELEAIRLADLENFYQEVAAEKMNVSRQTFGNIIKSARNKVADALLHGKVINIDGGEIEFNIKKEFCCKSCRKKQLLSLEEDLDGKS